MSLYFLDEEDIEDRELGLCTQNNTVLTALYALALISTVTAFIYQVSRITKRKQVIRLFPLLLGFVLHILVDVYKLSNIDGANLGEDPLFTGVLRNLELLHIFSITTSFQKYICYILKGTQLGNQELVRKANLFSTVSNYFLIMLWITIFMPREVGYNVIRIFFALTSFRNFYTPYLTYTLFGTITRDLRAYLALIEPSSPNQESQKSINIAKRSLVRISTLQKLSYFYGILCIIFLTLPSVFPFVMYTLGYQVPLLFIAWSILSIVAASTSKKRKKVSSNFTTTMKPSSGFGFRLRSATENSLKTLNTRIRENTEGLVLRITGALPIGAHKEIVYEAKRNREISI
eukprot:snap_masked-scaffold_5-processed-gene-0.10-mRNA-1 protein AED:1.00 eAED:1.00 QI:0/0/0/0/1/1/2/0/345